MRDSAIGVVLGTLQRTCFYPGFTVFSKPNSFVFMKGLIFNKGQRNIQFSKIWLEMNAKVNAANKYANNVRNQLFLISYWFEEK